MNGQFNPSYNPHVSVWTKDLPGSSLPKGPRLSNSISLSKIRKQFVYIGSFVQISPSQTILNGVGRLLVGNMDVERDTSGETDLIQKQTNRLCGGQSQPIEYSLSASLDSGVQSYSKSGSFSHFCILSDIVLQLYNKFLMTDGEGDLPLLVTERDRSRIFAIVIPDGKPEQIAPVAAKVVVVSDLSRLPGVFSYLAPRSWVA
jgi:hypothetical protein